MLWRIPVILLILLSLSCSMPWNSSYRRYSGPPPEDVAKRSCRDSTAAVRWVDLEDETERRILAHWCATVGTPVLADHRIDTDAGALDSLVVVSWNVHVGGGDVLRLVDNLRSGALTGRPVDDFVLMLQEVQRVGGVPMRDADFIPPRIEAYPPQGERLDVNALAKRLGLWVLYVPLMRNGPPGCGETEEDRGSAFLSTVPLDDLTAIELPYERNRRVVVAGTVVGETGAGMGWRMRMVNTHLSNRSEFSATLGTAGMVGRLRQARVLCAEVTETPALLAGDFNTWSPSTLERSIPLIRAQFPLPQDLDRKPTTRIRFAPDRRIDYFFFRLLPSQSAGYRRIDDTYGSDHYPLLAVVRFDGS